MANLHGGEHHIASCFDILDFVDFCVGSAIWFGHFLFLPIELLQYVVDTIEEILAFFRQGQISKGVEKGLGETLFGFDWTRGLIILDSILEDEKVEFDFDRQLYWVF